MKRRRPLLRNGHDDRDGANLLHGATCLQTQTSTSPTRMGEKHNMAKTDLFRHGALRPVEQERGAGPPPSPLKETATHPPVHNVTSSLSAVIQTHPHARYTAPHLLPSLSRASIHTKTDGISDPPLFLNLVPTEQEED